MRYVLKDSGESSQSRRRCSVDWLVQINIPGLKLLFPLRLQQAQTRRTARPVANKAAGVSMMMSSHFLDNVSYFFPAITAAH